jgi:hypothetical protein
MSQLESTFYIVGIISFILNIFLLLGVVLGLFFILRLVVDIRKKVTEKIKIVENVIKHPENAIADLSASIIRRSLRKLREKFSK